MVANQTAKKPLKSCSATNYIERTKPWRSSSPGLRPFYWD